MSRADDFVEIVEVVSRLYRGIDGLDFDLATSFMADVSLDVDEFDEGIPPIVGRDAVLAAMQKGLSKYDLTQHLIGSPIIQIEPDRARASFNVFGQHVIEGHPGGDTCLAGGTLEDEPARADDGWKISWHQVRVRWTTGNIAILGRPRN